MTPSIVARPIFAPRSRQCSALVAPKVKLFSTQNNHTKVQPIVELREYDIPPASTAEYMKHTTAAADLRKSLAPLRLFTMPETGGQLWQATHFYYYEGGYKERDERRSIMAKSKEWTDYLKKARPHMASQKSTIFVEAPLVVSNVNNQHVCGLSTIQTPPYNEKNYMNSGKNCIYELRRYRLKLGYDTVPNFLSLYEKGLPSKLNAEGTDPSTALITLLYTEVGHLNEVIELWRHGDGTAAMERSRVAARGATEWRQAIADIAGLAVEFTNTIHKPVAFSPRP